MNQQEYYELVLNLRSKCNLSRRKIAEHMHSRLSTLASSTLETDWIAGFENSGDKFRKALCGIEPNKTYFELFIECLKPTESEERKIRDYLNSEVELNKVELPLERARIDYQI